MAAAGLSLKELKDILDDNELDLSARGLTAVPKAITQIPRATNIDLTSNKITFLLPELCTMTKIVKLDLGCNKLIFLPDTFGNLTSLQHLTLYNNEIENLPLSFANLKSLKYLDMKKNPLVPELLKAAGPCNSEKECKQAAVNVIAHMKKEKLALEAQVAKQDKVNQKIAAANAEAKKAAKAKINKEKKAQEPKKTAEPATQPVEMASDKKQKKSENVKQKQQPAKKEGSSIVLMLIKYIIYAGLMVFLAASVNLFNDCYKNGGGQLVPGSKSFCTDMKKLTKFEKPSDKFLQHAQIAYESSFSGLRKGAVIAAEKVHGEAVVVYNNFDKYPIVKTVKKYAYQAHKEVSGVAFYVFTKAGDAYADLCKWYETEGHKMVGVVVDPIVVALKMSFEIAKDLANIAIDALATFLQRATVYVESILAVWQEKGFSAAVDAAFKH